MNLQLSSGAWIALICILGTVLLSGIVLFSAWRQRGKAQPHPPSRNEGYSFTRSWDKEDAEIKKLADAVKDLTGNKKDST